jgi:hypothetical protein
MVGPFSLVWHDMTRLINLNDVIFYFNIYKKIIKFSDIKNVFQ